MILSWREDRWQTEVSLFDAWNLDRDHREILSLTGGGGKTTVIRRLQKECMERHIFHGIATTTHMQYEKNENRLHTRSRHHRRARAGGHAPLRHGRRPAEFFARHA